MILELEIRQHAQFLDRALGQVLCLVDDQQGPLARGSGRHQEGLEREQEIGLLEAARWNPEGSGNQSQDVVRIDLGAHELRGDDLRGVQLLEEAAHQGCLARTDLTGNDDEAFVLVKAIFQVGHCTAMPPAAEKRKQDRG